MTNSSNTTKNRRRVVWGLALLIGAFAGCAAMKNVAQIAGSAAGHPEWGAAAVGAIEVAEASQLNDKDAENYGRCVAISATNTFKPSSNANLIQYVNKVGYTLVGVSGKPGRHCVFGVLDSPQPNAFSAPNGYIMVTRGALDLMQDESELAGVLAHEIAHLDKRHGLQALQQAKMKGAFLKIATSAAKIDEAMPALDTFVTGVMNKGYDQPQEFEADNGAVQLVARAGYDPHGLLHFLQRLQQKQLADPAAKAMSTHPGVAERINRVQGQIASLGTGRDGGATLAARFKQNTASGVTMVTPMPSGELLK